MVTNHEPYDLFCQYSSREQFDTMFMADTIMTLYKVNMFEQLFSGISNYTVNRGQYYFYGSDYSGNDIWPSIMIQWRDWDGTRHDPITMRDAIDLARGRAGIPAFGWEYTPSISDAKPWPMSPKTLMECNQAIGRIVSRTEKTRSMRNVTWRKNVYPGIGDTRYDYCTSYNAVDVSVRERIATLQTLTSNSPITGYDYSMLYGQSIALSTSTSVTYDGDEPGELDGIETIVGRLPKPAYITTVSDRYVQYTCKPKGEVTADYAIGLVGLNVDAYNNYTWVRDGDTFNYCQADFSGGTGGPDLGFDPQERYAEDKETYSGQDGYYQRLRYMTRTTLPTCATWVNNHGQKMYLKYYTKPQIPKTLEMKYPEGWS